MDLIFPLLILFMIGLVFMSSRQRKKQENQQQALQKSLNVGDVVVMTSGISGTVVDVDDERTIDLEIAPEVITTWLRAAVREKLVADETEGPDVVAAVPESSVPTETTPVVDGTGAPARDAKSDIPADSSDGVSSPRSS